MQQFTDTHAHIYHDDFLPDRADMLNRCSEMRVGKVYMPNVDHTSIDAMLELESRSEGICVSMMGLHPCSVKKDFERELYLVEDWLSKRSFAAVGEIGTDLYWDKSFFEQQKEAFTIQVNWAKKYGLPVVIHCRESIDETIGLVENLKDDNLTGIFHCFTGDLKQAQRIIALGFYIGIGGVITFKNGGLDKVVPEIALEHIMLETDSPYLAPVPHRGKRNEPAYIPLVADKIASLKRITIEEVQDVTTTNASKLFDPLPQ
ncbi:MAG: TatD family hydrolase [Chryseolinea sp.]